MSQSDFKRSVFIVEGPLELDEEVAKRSVEIAEQIIADQKGSGRYDGPDWKDFYKPEEAEEQLIGFKFLGPGWYETETDTILVFSSIVQVGKHKGRYEFWCWNSPDARMRFAKWAGGMLGMPVRT